MIADAKREMVAEEPPQREEVPLALMIPPTLPPDVTPGERRVYEALSSLPDQYTACYRRLFPGRRHVEEPDFVVMGADIGLVVLETKDWKGGRGKSDCGLRSADCGLKDGSADAVRLENPLEQAKRYVHGLQDLVREQGFPVLVETEGRHRSGLVFPCVPAVVFPYRSRESWEGDGSGLDLRHVLFREDLVPGHLVDRLRVLARLYFPSRLTVAQVDFLRGLVAPEFCLERLSAAESPRQLDLLQTQVVTTDLFLPPPEQRTVRDLSTRLVRGVAGSGKSLLLLMRAKLLQQLQPSWQILVLTYNRDLARFLATTFARLGGDPKRLQVTHFHKWCRDFLVEAKEWRDPLKESERLALVAKAVGQVDVAGVRPDSAAEEIAWIKEYIEPPIEDGYLAAQRTGRQGGLKEPQRRTILQILRRYEALRQEQKCLDWEDVPLRVLDLIQSDQVKARRYHAILVDETQDFAPSWFRVVLAMLKPETNLLFLAGDGAQRVYRRDLSWNRLGIQVRGRSRILRRVYRNTYEIGTYAATWMRKHGVAEDLGRYGEEWVDADFDHAWVRHGSLPFLEGFPDATAERTFVADEIKKLLAAGRGPSEVLVLHARRDAASACVEILKRAGIPATAVKATGLIFDPPTVNVCTFHSAKGLEFPIVFCSMTDLFPDSRTFDGEDAAQQAQAEAARLLYVGMTRARDQLFVTYIGK